MGQRERQKRYFEFLGGGRRGKEEKVREDSTYKKRMRKSLKNSCVLILNWDLGEREQS